MTDICGFVAQYIFVICDMRSNDGVKPAGWIGEKKARLEWARDCATKASLCEKTLLSAPAVEGLPTIIIYGGL